MKNYLLLWTWDTRAFLCLCNNISVSYHNVFAQTFEGIFCSQYSLVPFMKYAGFWLFGLCPTESSLCPLCFWKPTSCLSKVQFTVCFLRSKLCQPIDRNESAIQHMIEKSQLFRFQTLMIPPTESWWLSVLIMMRGFSVEVPRFCRVSGPDFLSSLPNSEGWIHELAENKKCWSYLMSMNLLDKAFTFVGFVFKCF